MSNRFKHAFGSCCLHLARRDYVSDCRGKQAPHQHPVDQSLRGRRWLSVIMFENTQRGSIYHPGVGVSSHPASGVHDGKNKTHILAVTDVKHTRAVTWPASESAFTPLPHPTHHHHIPHLLQRTAEPTDPLASSPP